jgi:hypothetical protein
MTSSADRNRQEDIRVDAGVEKDVQEALRIFRSMTADQRKDFIRLLASQAP